MLITFVSLISTAVAADEHGLTATVAFGLNTVTKGEVVSVRYSGVKHYDTVIDKLFSGLQSEGVVAIKAHDNFVLDHSEVKVIVIDTHNASDDTVFDISLFEEFVNNGGTVIIFEQTNKETVNIENINKFNPRVIELVSTEDQLLMRRDVRGSEQTINISRYIRTNSTCHTKH